MKVSRAQLITSGLLVVLIAGAALGAMALGRAIARGARPNITYTTEAPAAWRVTDVDGANGRSDPGFAGDIVQRLAFGEVVAGTGRVARVQGEAWREVARPTDATIWVLTGFLGRVDGGPVTPPTTTPPTTAPPTTTPPTTTPPTTAPPTTIPPSPVFGTEAPGVWQVDGIARGSVLNVRSGPGTGASIVARLAHDAVDIRSTGRIARFEGSLWRQVEYRTGGTGWVNAAFLERYVAPPPKPVFGSEKPGLWDVTAVGAGDSLNVRSGPGTSNPVVARLAHDAVALPGTGRIATVSESKWREVEYATGKTGWVGARFLTAHVAKPPKPTPKGIIVMGDWNGNGVRSPAVFRDGVWYLRLGNSGGAADIVFEFGAAGDRPVAGDWNGDGVETPGVVRGGVWHLRNSNSAGPADRTFAFGNGGDAVVVGDWDGNGVDTPGVFRNGTWHLRNSNSAGPADVVFTYGDPGDKPVAGDWDGNGSDSPGVVRGNQWLLRNSASPGAADLELSFGDPSDAPIAGDWDGDRVDTPGVVRGSSVLLRNRLSSGAADVSFTYDPPAQA